MELNDLLRAIVPLTFLAVWALSSILNKEANPLPNRPPQGFGPRPGGLPPGQRPPARAGAPVARDPTLRWGDPAAGAGPGLRRPQALSEDEVLVIRAEPTRAAGQPLPRPGSGTAAVRRTARAKAAPTTVPKRAEAKISRPLGGTTGLTRPGPGARALDDLAPLQGTQPGAASQPLSTVSVASRSNTIAASLSENSAYWRSLLNSRGKIREALVLNELLQPPLSMRRRRSI